MGSEREIIKEYNNGDLTIIWKPKTCIHSGECVRRLPNVYDPKAKPWIKTGQATAEELKEQINACPSGALSYRLNQAESVEPTDSKTKVEVVDGGPLLVYGEIEVSGPDGKIEMKKRTTAFCRCGATSNKPYCDGTHNSTGFSG